LVSPLRSAFPALDPRAIVQELRERVLDELDLEHEATMQRRFHRALRGHPLLTVPAPVMRLSHESVLVSEWLDGVPLWRAPDRDQAAARLVLFAIGGARIGLLPADLHPDDVLVLADGRVAIVDFGATHAVDTARLDAAASALDALAEGDAIALGEALQRLGWFSQTDATAMLALTRDALGELAQPGSVRLDSASVVALGERLRDRRAELIELLLAGRFPASDVLAAVGFAQVFGSIARIGASGSWRELVQAALKDGWAARAGD
jgi:predicted unusual protein kinase regulating ubiquinone biosynthesis (AarF/ABC1/UbiB family)